MTNFFGKLSLLMWSLFKLFSGFKELQKLQRHKLSHTGLRPFQCQFCDKSFGLLHNMKSHEKIHVVSWKLKVWKILISILQVSNAVSGILNLKSRN